MSGFFKIKTLVIWMLVAAPAVGVWVQRKQEKSPTPPAAKNFVYEEQAPTLRVPVEVFAKGSKHETVYVDLGPLPVPEPSTSILFLVTGVAAVLRRRR